MNSKKRQPKDLKPVLIAFDHSRGHRRGALIVWAIPALAVLAAATYWLFSPGNRTAASPATKGPVSVSSSSAASKTASSVTHNPKSERVTSQFASGAKGSTAAAPEVKPKPASRPSPTTTATRPAARSAAEMEKALVGEWTGYYQGDRELTVTADGEGKMVARPEGLAATLLAAELTFKIRWTLIGDKLEFETVGGEPLDKVNIVVKMYGQRRSHKILDLQPDTMVLLDEDGVTKYSWNRVTSEPQATAAPEKEE